MARSASKLARGLADLAKNYPGSPEEAGKRWAHAYAEYAADAQNNLAAPPTLAGAEALLAETLGKVWRGSRTAYTSAQGIAAALTVFWLTPPVVFGTGVVTAVGGTSALASSLPGIWASNQAGKQSSEFCANKVAAAVHAFTTTVITTTPPGPVVAPIT